MSGFPVIDVVVGLAFLYLLFALACTTLNEVIAAVFDRRARMLRQGIEQLLGDKGLADAVYGHPSIVSLAKPHGTPGAGPSYIPAERFAAALVDHVTGAEPLTNAKALAAGIRQLPPAASRQLQVLFQLSKDDPDDFHKRVASWYDETMDRVTGWYKRAVQRQTYVMAIIVVLLLNLDAVQLFNRLWSDSAFRTQAIEQARARIEATGIAEMPIMEYTEGDKPDAGTPVQTGTTSLTDSEKQLLTSLRGWSDDRERLAADLVRRGDGIGVRSAWMARSVWNHLLGWLITILAISLGAPFWFDLLNRFVNLRSAGRATDEPRSKA
jgi:hypothetical protein